MSKYDYTFNGVKETYDNYYFVSDSNGNLIVVDRITKEKNTDKELIDRLQFSISWVECVGLVNNIDIMNLSLSDKGFRYHQAFDLDSKMAYRFIMDTLKDQIDENDYIDSNKVLDKLHKGYRSLYSVELIEYLLGDEYYLKSTDRWVKHLMGREIIENHKPIPLNKENIKKVKSYKYDKLKK